MALLLRQGSLTYFRGLSSLSSRNKAFTKPVVGFLKLIGASEGEITELRNKLSPDQRNILNRISTVDTPIRKMTFDEAFHKFCTKAHVWGKFQDRYLFWDNYNHLRCLKVLKLQMNGTCSFQSAAVLQHYLITINNNVDVNCGMVDIPSFLRAKYNSVDKLMLYLSPEYPGPSARRNFQEMALVAEQDLLTVHAAVLTAPADHCQAILHRIAKAPALVSAFGVFKDFMDTDSVQFGDHDAAKSAISEEGYVGIHSMVMIGGRVDCHGNYYFLLQNWWADRPFIEVSYKYLVACKAELVFVEKKITEIPSSPFLKKTFELALSTCVDKGGEELTK